MTLTTLANLALSKIGQTLITNLGDTSNKSARLASLHLVPCLKEVLRAHFWGFATTMRPLVAVDVREYLAVSGALKVAGVPITVPRLYLGSGFSSKDNFLEDEVADNPDPQSECYWSGDNEEWRLRHGPTDALWSRGIDVASPELTTLRPRTPIHTLETDLTGDDNDLRFSQIDQLKAAVSIEYLTPDAITALAIYVTGTAITVAPTTKHRMQVTGTLSGDATGILIPCGTYGGKTQYSNDGTPYVSTSGVNGHIVLYYDVGRWHLKRQSGTFSNSYYARFISEAAFPDGLVTWDIQTGTGQPTIAALATRASEVKAALEANAAVAALITIAYKTGNSGAGTVTGMARATLAGGVTGTPYIERINPATELLGWDYAFEMPSDFMKLRELLPTAGGRKIDRFELRRMAGKNCLLCDTDAVSLKYVQYVDDPVMFDPLFVSAFTALFASKLARAISGSDDLEAKFLQIYESVALPAARTAAGHDSESNENHPLREFLDGNLTPGRGDFFNRP